MQDTSEKQSQQSPTIEADNSPSPKTSAKTYAFRTRQYPSRYKHASVDTKEALGEQYRHRPLRLGGTNSASFSYKHDHFRDNENNKDNDEHKSKERDGFEYLPSVGKDRGEPTSRIGDGDDDESSCWVLRRQNSSSSSTNPSITKSSENNSFQSNIRSKNDHSYRRNRSQIGTTSGFFLRKNETKSIATGRPHTSHEDRDYVASSNRRTVDARDDGTDNLFAEEQQEQEQTQIPAVVVINSSNTSTGSSGSISPFRHQQHQQQQPSSGDSSARYSKSLENENLGGTYTYEKKRHLQLKRQKEENALRLSRLRSLWNKTYHRNAHPQQHQYSPYRPVEDEWNIKVSNSDHSGSRTNSIENPIVIHDTDETRIIAKNNDQRSDSTYSLPRQQSRMEKQEQQYTETQRTSSLEIPKDRSSRSSGSNPDSPIVVDDHNSSSPNGEPFDSQHRATISAKGGGVDSSTATTNYYFSRVVQENNVLIDLIRHRKQNKTSSEPECDTKPNQNLALHETILDMLSTTSILDNRTAFEQDDCFGNQSKGPKHEPRDRSLKEHRRNDIDDAASIPLKSDLVRSLLRTNPKALEKPGRGGYLPLHIACSSSFWANQSDPGSSTTRTTTTLRLDLIRSMLESHPGGAFHNENETGELPLHILIRWICFRQKSWTRKKYTLKEKAPVDDRGDDDDESIAMFLLMTHPQGANVRDRHGRTPSEILQSAIEALGRDAPSHPVLQRLDRHVSFASKLPLSNTIEDDRITSQSSKSSQNRFPPTGTAELHWRENRDSEEIHGLKFVPDNEEEANIIVGKVDAIGDETRDLWTHEIQPVDKFHIANTRNRRKRSTKQRAYKKHAVDAENLLRELLDPLEDPP